MPEPIAVGPLTRRLYDRLPEFRRDDDAREPSGGTYPLLRYLEGLLTTGNDAETLADRLEYEPGAPGDTSDLVDPATADAAWLPWLAQLVGAELPLDATVADQRTAIAGAVSGFQAGSRQALRTVAQRALTGTRYVAITPNLDGNPWRIGLATLVDETPDTAAVVNAITEAGAKPAGYELAVTFYSATWDTLEARYPTSDAWDAVASSDALEQTH